MKSFSPGRGWIFLLEDGPWKGQTLRLGWTTKPGTDELAMLDPAIQAPGGRYVKMPWYDKHGKPMMRKGVKGTPVHGVVYEWVPSEAE